MKDESGKSTEAVVRYATAHAAHYGEKDLDGALGLYRSLVAAWPDSTQAGYAQSQIASIVRAVVPIPALLDAQVALGKAHIELATSQA